MVNANGSQGYRFERALAKWFNDHGFLRAKRTHKYSPLGDIEGIPNWTIEAKDVNDKRLDECLDQALASSVKTGDPNYCVIYKNRGNPIEDAYVVMRLDRFTEYIALHEVMMNRAS